MFAHRHVVSLMLEKFSLMRHFGALMRYLLLGQVRACLLWWVGEWSDWLAAPHTRVQGEFFQCLMDLLVPELGKPATKIYRHKLVSALEMAIRASNAQYEPAEVTTSHATLSRCAHTVSTLYVFCTQVLKRLDVHMYEASPEDTGWDVFSLNYHVSSPVNVVISPTATKRYLKVRPCCTCSDNPLIFIATLSRSGANLKLARRFSACSSK